MRIRLGLATALLACAAALPAQAQQRLIAAQSEIAFTSKQMGVPVSGHFRSFDADVAFDPQRPEAARIRIGIDMASVTLASSEAEAELALPGWFDRRRKPRFIRRPGQKSTSKRVAKTWSRPSLDGPSTWPIP